jgi:hypothetical protein
MRRFLFAVFLVVACATVAAAGAIEEAQSAYQRRDYALAAQLFRPLAEEGRSGAQLRLGGMYILGQGVPKDNAEGLKWIRRAAEQGHPRTQTGLGSMYELGAGAPQDYQETVKWYRKAAVQGDAWGQRKLAEMYANGQGVPQDFVRADMWYNLATAETPARDLDEHALKLRDHILSRITAPQMEKALEMVRRCQQFQFTDCD